MITSVLKALTVLTVLTALARPLYKQALEQRKGRRVQAVDNPILRVRLALRAPCLPRNGDCSGMARPCQSTFVVAVYSLEDLNPS